MGGSCKSVVEVKKHCKVQNNCESVVFLDDTYFSFWFNDSNLLLVLLRNVRLAHLKLLPIHGDSFASFPQNIELHYEHWSFLMIPSNFCTALLFWHIPFSVLSLNKDFSVQM